MHAIAGGVHWAVMKIETRAVHAGRHIDPATGAVTLPIHLSTTFERTAEGEYPQGFSYSREGNPNRRALEECLADLEGGKEALVFSLGPGGRDGGGAGARTGRPHRRARRRLLGTAQGDRRCLRQWGLEPATSI